MGKKLIRFDWAIKRLLRNKANFVVLEGFLSELLFDTIKIEQILESEGNQLTDDEKFNRVDILTKNSKNELIIIEIQSTYEIDYFQRMAFGVSKSITENLKIGQKYAEIRKVISINIVYFNLGQGQDYIYKGKTDFRGIHQDDLLGLSEKQKSTFLKSNVSDIFPEYYLLKVNQFNNTAKDTLDEWIYFLKNSEVKDDFRAKGLKEAGEVLDIMRLEKEDQYGYNRYLDSLHLKASELFSLQTEEEFRVREQGRIEGKLEGKKEGKLEEKVEIVRNAIQAGLDDLTIHHITKLPIEEIQALRRTLTNG